MGTTSKAHAKRLLEQLTDTEHNKAIRHDNTIIFPSIKVAPEAVLGCFMTAGLMEVFREQMERTYRNTTDRALPAPPIRFELTNDDRVNQHATQQIHKLIESAKCTHPSDFVYENKKGLKISLPRRIDFRLDLCEKFTIADTDRRVQLRGQRGLRARTFVQMHTVLGVYRGLILPKVVTDHNLVRHPREGWRGTVNEWEDEIRRYMMETDFTVLNPVTGRKETIPLDISPYGYESPGGLINDPRIVPAKSAVMDPFLSGEKLRLSTDGLMEVVAPENTTVQVAYVCGFPFPFVITTKAMIAGEELLFHYGRDMFLMSGHFPEQGKFRLTGPE